jgi:hypothetical protein
VLLWIAVFAAGAIIGFEVAWIAGLGRTERMTPSAAPQSRGEVTFVLSAIIDGSDRLIFTRENVWNEHGAWGRPKEVQFNGELWEDLSQAPPSWTAFAAALDLQKARIVTREGRDMISLEPTAEGFDLYFADTQMGAARYTVTVSIPRQ